MISIQNNERQVTEFYRILISGRSLEKISRNGRNKMRNWPPSPPSRNQRLTNNSRENQIKYGVTFYESLSTVSIFLENLRGRRQNKLRAWCAARGIALSRSVTLVRCVLPQWLSRKRQNALSLPAMYRETVKRKCTKTHTKNHKKIAGQIFKSKLLNGKRGMYLICLSSIVSFTHSSPCGIYLTETGTNEMEIGKHQVILYKNGDTNLKI